MEIDFEKWMFDMQQDYGDISDADGDLDIDFEKTKTFWKKLYDDYYSARSNGDKSTCKALFIDFCNILDPFKMITPAQWQISSERSSIEVLMYSSLHYCMTKQDWKNFYFVPQASVCNDRYHVDFGAFKQDDRKIFLALECDGFNYHYADKKQVSKDNNRTRDIQYIGIEVLRIIGADIYKSPIAEAEKILNHIRGKYFEGKYKKRQEL